MASDEPPISESTSTEDRWTTRGVFKRYVHISSDLGEKLADDALVRAVRSNAYRNVKTSEGRRDDSGVVFSGQYRCRQGHF